MSAAREFAAAYEAARVYDGGATSQRPTAAEFGASGVAAAALDQSHDLIVILDGDGTIVLTNAAWREGADRRGASTESTGCGVHYFEVCEDSDEAVVAEGLRAVLAGDHPRFEFDYSCHSPEEDAWWALEAVPLGEPGSGLLLTHTNITAHVIATRLNKHGRDVEPVTMLATSPAGVKGLARMLAHAQTHENSLAMVTITMLDLVDIESRHGRRSRDELVVHVVARVLRLTRAEDAMIRASTSHLVLFAAVADAPGGEFLRGRIAEALEAPYLVGAADIPCRTSVAVATSDRFSTLDSLLNRLSGAPPPLPPRASETAGADVSDGYGRDSDDDRGSDSPVPLMVYSLPDGYLQAANDAAISLFGLRAAGPERLHARDISDPSDLRSAAAALAALSSGATDSYRAHRTLMTAEGPLVLVTSVRRLRVRNGSLAAALTVPAHSEEAREPASEDPFSAALVAGTIDAHGAIDSVSSPGSPMETTLVGALTDTVTLAAHPDDAELVDMMLESMRRRGSATGAFRVPHAEQGWVVCQCLLFTIKHRPGDRLDAESTAATDDTFAFVLSATVSTETMADKVVRLENHIRRIGSEVHAADLELTTQPAVSHGVSDALDALVLTARQRDIVERLVQGQRVPSIANELFISRSTVRNHLAQVYRLVGVHSQEELLNALRAG